MGATAIDRRFEIDERTQDADIPKCSTSRVCARKQETFLLQSKPKEARPSLADEGRANASGGFMR